MKRRDELNALIKQAGACTVCAPFLLHGPRPIFQLGGGARILIAGQAPGARAHASGVPFGDASGARLREWMGVSRETFYDKRKIAILPLSFCFPGRGRRGDLPPRPECAPKWRNQFLSVIPDIQLTLILGAHAMAWHLPHKKRYTLRQVVHDWKTLDSDTIVLPHPSPRNNAWFKNNSWFEAELLPVLAKRVKSALG